MKENKECYPYQQFHENRKKKKISCILCVCNFIHRSYITVSINMQHKQKNHQKYTPNHKLSISPPSIFVFLCYLPLL